MTRAPLGQVLKHEGWLNDDAIEAALDHQRRWHCRFGDALLRLRLLPPDALRDVLSRHLGIRAVLIGDAWLTVEALERIDHLMIIARRVIPISIEDQGGRRHLVVATTEPNDLRLVDDLIFAAGMPVETVLATEEDIDQAISRHYAIMRRDAIPVASEPTAPMELDTNQRSAPRGAQRARLSASVLPAA